MYDLIGDIHGHAEELEKLLVHLGYSMSDSGYSHPERKVIFLGDFIDRGEKLAQHRRLLESFRKRPMLTLNLRTSFSSGWQSAVK